MAESRLTAVISTKGTEKANKELKGLTTSSKKLETNVIRAESKFKSLGKNAAASLAVIDGPLGSVSGRVTSLTTVLTSGTAAMTLFAGAVVGFGVVLVQGISNLDEFELNLKRVNATIKATGEGVGFTGEALRDEAEAIALATLTSVDAVQKAQAKLLTFNRVLGDEFSRSIKLSQDLAETGFGSIESNAILLGKALQDPIKGMASLSRVGVTLSETQKQLAEDAVNAGDVFAAQGIILDAIAGQVEGVAEAVANGTLAGAIDTLGQNWDELTRTVADNSGALTVWTRIVNGAAITAKNITDALADDSSDDIWDARLEAAQRLATAETELESAMANSASGYGHLQIRVNKLKEEVSSYDYALKAAIETDNKLVNANSEAHQKEIEARKAITEQVKAESEAKEAAEKKAADSKLQRQKDSAQKELETILNLNNSELEAIDVKEAARIEKVKASYAQQLISLEEFQTAKTEIELNASTARQAIADADALKAQEETDKALASIKSVSDSLVDAAVSGGSLGDVIESTMLAISKSVIKSGVDILVNQLLVDKTAGAALTIAKTAEVSSTVAQAGLNTFASISAIPVVGPAAAPAAAAAAIGVATGMGAAVLAPLAARAQGGHLNAGQESTFAEKGELEILTPASASSIKTASQMRSIMGNDSNGGGNNVSIVVIDQSTGSKDFDQSTDDDGKIILMIRDTVSLDLANSNSGISKSLSASTTSERRR